MKDLNGLQLAYREVRKDIKFFNQSGLEVQYLSDHNNSAVLMIELTFFYLIDWTHLGKRMAVNPTNESTDMICTISDSQSPKGLFNVSDAFREGKNVNDRPKCQTPPMPMVAEGHENDYSDFATNSEESGNEYSDEDIVLDRDNANSQETSCNAIPSFISVCELKKTLKLTTDTFDCDNVLVKHENVSVLNIVRSWISKGKLPTKDVESRRCKGLLGYPSHFENRLLKKKHNKSVAKANLHLNKFA